MLLEAWSRLLDTTVAQGRLRALDAAFARFLAEQEPIDHSAVPLLGAWVSQQAGEGHLCLDLDALDALADQLDWPSTWRELLSNMPVLFEQLATSPIVAVAGQASATPLVWDGTRLYLRRYWNHERLVASAIRQRVLADVQPPSGLKQQLLRQFPDHGNRAVQWPRIACALAARSAFTIITGGPGTGKTTAVVRLLGLLQTLQLAEHSRPLRIRLAAPTGKAAARLNASIASQVAALDVDDAVRAAVPTDVVTLHRLLGARSESRRFHHHAGNLLHLDVLVIDEASMIDLELMSAVLVALPPQARLILLGDKDQLSSVEAGAVLGDLCSRAEDGHYSEDTAAWLVDVANDDIAPWVRADAEPLDQHIAMLRESHRFDATSGIGHLAHLVNSGDKEAVHRLLRSSPADIAWIDTLAGDDTLSDLVLGKTPLSDHGYRHYLRWLEHYRPPADSPASDYQAWAEQTLRAFNRFQLLCGVRQGRDGTSELNREIPSILHRAGLIDATYSWYEGRPVMVTRNDYSLGLVNGDVGIALRVPDEHGELKLRVAFATSEGIRHDATAAPAVRFVLPSRLGHVETAFAMTVHKAQGSEFDDVALVLPDHINPVLSRELLYTAITRARRWMAVVGGQAVIDWMIDHPVMRHSGLKAHWNT